MQQDIKKVTVSLSDRSYPILIGKQLLGRAGMWLPEDIAKRKVFIITDEHVADPHAALVQAAVRDVAAQVMTYVLPAGEKTKSFTFLQQTIEWMIENGANRQSLIIAIGGGVVGDLAGFCAASLLRGVDFIQIPTTLLAQVDSSVGGKTGINSASGKNLIGAFYQPKAVVIDLDTLETLPEREIKAGYAEILKYGLLGDIRFFEWLEANGEKLCAKDPEALAYAIETSCKMKAEIVRQDEREETGLRALLNLGHTFAHALETSCEYDGRLLHGEAVGIGLVLAGRLSEKLGYIQPAESSRIQKHLSSLKMMTEIRDINPPVNANAEQLLSLMQKDKKATADGLNFVVLQATGRARLDKSASRDQVLGILKESLTHV
jgi:3-dehydroquinate synthase